MVLQVGDFVAIAVLTAEVIKALASSRGSKFEFTSLVSTLKGLGQAMLQAEAVAMEWNTSFMDSCEDIQLRGRLDIIAQDLVREKEECQDLIANFMKDFDSYTRAFHAQSNKLRSQFRKLTWAMCRDEVATFEKRLHGHLQALQLSLHAFYYATLRNDVDSSINMLITRFDSMNLKISEAVAKLNTVHRTMPPLMGYSWGPDLPVLLLDALGRQMCFPMILASSPDVFRDVLLITHKNCPGYDRIQSGKYVVSDEDADGALVPRDRWRESIRPGRHIAVSFLLKHPGAGSDEHCPRCNSSKTRSHIHPGERKCLRCQLEFKVESRDQVQMFWKNLKPRPKLPKHKSSPEPSPKPNVTISNPERPQTDRSSTLPPDQYRHQYRRVHYQRDVFRRGSVDQRWDKTDPELERFLDALPPLHSAAATGNINKLDELLESQDNPDINWKVTDSLYRYDRTGWDFTGAPPIHFAAYFGHNGAVRFLLRCGADVDARDAAGTTALHAAAWTGNEELFKMLLQRGADSTIHDYDGWSVLIYAMIQGHDNVARLTLGSSDDSQQSMLIQTLTVRRDAKLGNTEAVMDALPVPAKDEEYEDIMEVERREMILSGGLVGAAEGGHGDLIQKLLGMGADPTATDITGSTALHWAVWGGHAEVENLRYDAERRSADDNEDQEDKTDHDNSVGDAKNISSTSAIQYRLQSRSLKHELVIQMLVEGGVDINTQNAQGCSPLHWAAGSGSISVIQFLLDMGADPHLRDHDGRSPIDRALETGDEDVIRRLVDGGTKSSRPRGGVSILSS